MIELFALVWKPVVSLFGLTDVFKAFEIAVLIVEPDLVESAPVVWRRLAIDLEFLCFPVEI